MVYLVAEDKKRFEEVLTSLRTQDIVTDFTRGEINVLEEILNESRVLDEDLVPFAYTGMFRTTAEFNAAMNAGEKADNELVQWIQNWDFNSYTDLGALLIKKFKEYREYKKGRKNKATIRRARQTSPIQTPEARGNQDINTEEVLHWINQMQTGVDTETARVGVVNLGNDY